MTKHTPTECRRVKGLELRYSFRNWSDKFVCPQCDKSRRYSLNFLGSRPVVCNGEKITAKTVTDVIDDAPALTWRQARELGLIAKARGEVRS